MEERNSRKVREGLVTSNKMDKSIVVSVERKLKHPKYGTTKRTSAESATEFALWKPDRSARTNAGA